MGESTIPVVTFGQAKRIARLHFQKGEPVCFLSAPGSGKTEGIGGEAVKFFGVPYHPFVASTRQPTDAMGIPMPDRKSKTMVWYPPSAEDLPVSAPGCILADDITGGTQSMQQAMLGLFDKTKTMGSYHCPEGVGRVALGNRAGDKTGAGRMITALSNRLSTYEARMVANDWAPWALGEGNILPEIVACVRWYSGQHRPDDSALQDPLNDFNPDRAINATARSWARTSRLVADCDKDLRQIIAGATVGEGWAAVMEGFFSTWGQMPDPDGILLDPKNGMVPDLRTTNGPALMYALCAALAQRCKAGTGAAIVTYAERLPDEFALCLIRDAQAVNPGALTSNREFQRWALANQSLLSE